MSCRSSQPVLRLRRPGLQYAFQTRRMVRRIVKAPVDAAKIGRFLVVWLIM